MACTAMDSRINPIQAVEWLLATGRSAGLTVEELLWPRSAARLHRHPASITYWTGEAAAPAGSESSSGASERSR